MMCLFIGPDRIAGTASNPSAHRQAEHTPAIVVIGVDVEVCRADHRDADDQDQGGHPRCGLDEPHSRRRIHRSDHGTRQIKLPVAGPTPPAPCQARPAYRGARKSPGRGSASRGPPRSYPAACAVVHSPRTAGPSRRAEALRSRGAGGYSPRRGGERDGAADGDALTSPSRSSMTRRTGSLGDDSSSGGRPRRRSTRSTRR